jgi:hypothetical protein
MSPDQFIGLPKKDAQNLAERFNFIFRLIRIDDKNMFSYPEDSRDDRVCVEIEKGVVVHAAIQ